MTITKALNELGIRDRIGERTTIEVPSLGISVQIDAQNIVRVVHLYSEGVDGFTQFPLLLQGLQMNSTKEDVLQILGEPYEQGSGTSSEHLGLSGPWDAYLFSDRRIHFEYFHNAASIRLITITN
jgi:hypothetical protein